MIDFLKKMDLSYIQIHLFDLYSVSEMKSVVISAKKGENIWGQTYYLK